MPAHIHADLMKQYYEDALETDKPWERWEYRCSERMPWKAFKDQMFFAAAYEYRRKPVALCQIEGRDVFPGDRLWSKTRGEWVIVGGKFADSDSHLRVGSHDSEWPDNLSWSEPAKTRTVYQWAYGRQNSLEWHLSSHFYEVEKDFRTAYELTDHIVRRLDYTALEVPA